MNVGAPFLTASQHSPSATTEWWRTSVPVQGTRTAPGRTAFAALLLYTVVLVAAPQEFVRGLAPLRLAFVAAAAALAAYVMDRLAGRLRTPAWPRT